MRQIRTLRAMRRELEPGPRHLLPGHEGGNPGYRQGAAYGLPRQFPTLPRSIARGNHLGPGWAEARFKRRRVSSSVLEFVDRLAFCLTQNQARGLAVGVQDELRDGACRLKLGLRQRKQRKSIQVELAVQ